MTERTLTERQLNRALLARQMLLERSGLPLTKAVERMGGVQSQYAPSSYIGLWTRLAGFERGQLTRALERRTLARGTLMRSTIHIVTARDYWPLAAAIREDRRKWWLGATRHQISEREVAAVAEQVRALLADGPRRRKDLVAELGVSSTMWNGVGGWVDLLRVPPSGTWERRSADLYGLAETWLRGAPDETPDAGLELIVRRYLGAFGPASHKDIANWAGISPTAISPTLERMRLRRFRDERDGELLDLPRAPLPDADVASPVRFLPTWDATLLVHARRTQILPERFRPMLFDTKTPHSSPSFLIDGQVAGTWKHDGTRVVVSPFEPLPRTARRELDEEAKQLAAWLA
ncbi:MAG: winged helix DNA-binding domain-containing protein [Actinomycetota bacterium]